MIFSCNISKDCKNISKENSLPLLKRRPRRLSNLCGCSSIVALCICIDFSIAVLPIFFIIKGAFLPLFVFVVQYFLYRSPRYRFYFDIFKSTSMCLTVYYLRWNVSNIFGNSIGGSRKVSKKALDEWLEHNRWHEVELDR